MDVICTRRSLLGAGGKALLAAGAGAGALGLATPPSVRAIDWSALWKKKGAAGGFGIVRELVGEAFAGETPLKVGSRVASGQAVKVAPKGRLVLNMSDRSVFQFTGPASLELILSMMREGIINLIQGAILAVIPFGNQYLAAGPTSTVGIKGTVFYREVYGEPGPLIQTMEGAMHAPENAREYHCTCNGRVAFHGASPEETLLEDRAEHHSSYFIDPALPGRLFKAPMANHTDEQILRLISLQQGEKHDATWIERYRQSLRRG